MKYRILATMGLRERKVKRLCLIRSGNGMIKERKTTISKQRMKNTFDSEEISIRSSKMTMRGWV